MVDKNKGLFFVKKQTLLAAVCCNDGECVTNYILQGYPCRTAVYMTSIGIGDPYLRTS